MSNPVIPAASATIAGVLTDLNEVARRLAAGQPMDQLAIEHEARICDRLAEEIAEAAEMLRQASR